ncbi:MAG: hypothetical protein IJ542_00490 [Clostridia bacterium]|nr:hypothetical protein [Clostridia bacterium]
MNDYERIVALHEGFDHLFRFYLMTEKFSSEDVTNAQKLEVCEIAKSWVRAFEIDDIFPTYLQAYEEYKAYPTEQNSYHSWTKLEKSLDAETKMEFLDGFLSAFAIALIREATNSKSVGTRKLQSKHQRVELSAEDKIKVESQRKERKKWIQRYVERHPEMEEYLAVYLDDFGLERD